MKNRITVLLLVMVVILFVSIGAAILLRPTLSTLVRNRLENSLSQQFESHITFSDYHFSLFPFPSATLSNLTLLHRDRKDVPPLIQVSEFSMRIHWTAFLAPRMHVAAVNLKGLRITLPPRENVPAAEPRPNAGLASKFPIFIDHLHAEDASIILLRAQPEKRPLVYQLHRLDLKSLSFLTPADFDATLTNAVPRGEIHAHGTFGPWDSDNPRATPVQASYTFLDVDLGTIKGLQGTLSSRGTFRGPLDYLEVQGSTSTPDFSLRRVASPVELTTKFSATVDGTNGNTYLHSVEAHFLHSVLFTKGEVVDLDSDVRGRTINLDIQSNDARAEDLIRLAVKTARPVLGGPVKLRARIRIPEEDLDLTDRLDVTAQFTLSQGQFNNPDFQEKVDLLSRKGQGEPKNTEIVHVPSELVASMHAKQGVIEFSQIHFEVPGAQLALAGTYTLGVGQLAFNGNLYLDAKLSQTTTGAKSLFLKPIDPFFRGKNGGARIPVKIEGTKDHPVFGLGHQKSAKHGVPPITPPVRPNLPVDQNTGYPVFPSQSGEITIGNIMQGTPIDQDGVAPGSAPESEAVEVPNQQSPRTAIQKLRILVADDHDIIRRGLRQLLMTKPGWEIVGEAKTGREAVTAAEQLKPDVIVMDISMPDLNGLDAARQLQKTAPQIGILILTMYFTDQLVREVVDCGARGYILKSDADRELVNAVEALANRRTYFTREASEILLNGYSRPDVALDTKVVARNRLTAREREIVQLLADGKSSKEVANALKISVKTAETHRANIMRKLELHSVSELVRYAIRNQIIGV